MATNELKTRIKHAYKTESDWTSSNPVLLKGEVAYSSDKNNKYKVGDGTHKWSDLTYAIPVTKSDIGLSSVDNTADANKSVKYATSAGSATTATSATNADNATVATKIVDYNNQSQSIKVGYSGNGISGNEIKYIAGYTTGDNASTARIKDVSKDSLRSWLNISNVDSTNGLFSGYTKSANFYQNVVELNSTSTVDEIVVKTSIPFISSDSMPAIFIKGYAYGEYSPIDITVAFYIYDNAFCNMGCTSVCPWKPTIYLSSYTKDSKKYVALSLNKSIYYSKIAFSFQDIWSGNRNTYAQGWTISSQLKGSSATIIPQTDIVTVPYRKIANNISGDSSTVNGHTVNSDVPSGAKFTDTVYTHPSYTSKSNGLYKVAVDSTGHVSGTTAVTKSDITALGIPASDTNTDTKVTSVGNHYTPSGGTTKSASGGTATNATGSGNAVQVVTGVTVDAAGHVTGVTSKGVYSTDTTYSLPTASSSTLGGVKTTSTVTSTSGLTACPIISGVPYYKDTDTNTDTKVTNTLATTTKAYVTGTTSASTNTGTQVFDTGVYLDKTAGRLHVTSIGVGNGIMSYDSTKKCIVISVS